jgi:CPA1 family monovalent cation:H+ antiporter
MHLSEVVLIVTGLLALAMLAAGVSRATPLPYTVFLVILGGVLGEIGRLWPPFAPLLEFRLSPEVVLFLFLPGLIFESAFNLDSRQLVKDLAPVMALAIPALLVSTVAIGAGLWWLLGMDLLLALLFGALISATDPVAVIALFKELGAPLRLTILVEGESLLNDATAIVVFNIVLGLIVTGAVGWGDLGNAAYEFVRVFAGGALVGFALGWVVSAMLQRIGAGLNSFLVMSLVLAYAGFTIADHLLHVSGVMAVIGGAIALGIFGAGRMTQSDVHVVKETWDAIALICNSLLFLLMGISVDPAQVWQRLDVILLATVLVLFARAATVYTLVPATIRAFALPAVSRGDCHIMWWGGLKGGLAIAIALSIPQDIAGRDLLLDLTLGVVLFSLLVNAPTIRPLIRRLGIDRLSADEETELHHGLNLARSKANQTLDGLQRAELVKGPNARRIRAQLAPHFEAATEAAPAAQVRRHLYSEALKRELEELKHLYELGFMQQYIYLDMRNTLHRDRELHLGEPGARPAAAIAPKQGLFVRLENWVLHRLRERDWAAGILARYQYLRFSQSVQRDIAGVLTGEAVLKLLETDRTHDTEYRNQLAETYRARIARRRARLHNVAMEYPDFYRRLELHLFTKVALRAAQIEIEAAGHHGAIGAKVLARICHRLDAALAGLPPISSRPQEPETRELIDAVPVLEKLPAKTLERLAAAATAVTFLPGDVIIGEGEKGDALYLISRGAVSVSREGRDIATLGPGEFFGEMALLGDQVRTATVRARIPSTLLRLRRRDVLAVAEREPILRQRLEEISARRRAAD